MEQPTPNPVGRPSKYTEELLKKAAGYVAYAYAEDKLPSLEGLALYIGVRRSTIYEWQKDPAKQDFSDIVDNILAHQAETLINKGLKGEYNSSITKVILTKHNYSDKQEVDLSSSDGTMRPTVIELVAP
jgi:hypothetical protein